MAKEAAKTIENAKETSLLVRNRAALFAPVSAAEKDRNMFAVLLKQGHEFDATDKSETSLASRFGYLTHTTWYRGAGLKPWGLRVALPDTAAAEQDIHLQIARSALAKVPDIPVETIARVFLLNEPPQPDSRWQVYQLERSPAALFSWLESWKASYVRQPFLGHSARR